MSPDTRPLCVGWAVKPASTSERKLLSLSRKDPADFRFNRLDSLEGINEIHSQAAHDLLLLELDFPGLQAYLHAGSASVPVVLLVDSQFEADALALLEQGLIADYLLTTPAQLKRLPLVLKSAAARQPQSGGTQAAHSKAILQEALYQIADASEKAESLEELLPHIHEIVGRVMPASNFYIALYDAAEDMISYPYFVDEADVLVETTYKAKRGLSEYVMRSGKSLLCPRELQEAMTMRGDIDIVGPPSETWLGAPLMVDGTPIGIMVVQHYRDSSAYSEQDQRMLEFVSSQVGMVIRRKQAQDDLRQSEERLRQVFDNTNVGLGRVSLDGTILLANAALVRMLGYGSFAEMQKVNLHSQVYVEDISRRLFLQQMEKDGQARGFASAWRKADGSIFYIQEDAHLVRDASGRAQYYETVIQDVTERRQAEISLRQKVTALQSLAEIDREILAAEDAKAILELVCDRVASLLHVPKTAILTTEGSPLRFTVASYGFENEALLKENLKEGMERGMASHWESFARFDMADAPEGGLMPQLRRRERLRAMAIEPFSTAGGLRGALAVFDTKPRTWLDEETQLVRLLAGQAALALEKIRLLNAARRRANEFAGLYHVAGELMDRRDTNAVISLIVNEASGLHEASHAFIYMFNEKNQELTLTVATGEYSELGTVIKPGEGMAGRVAQTREPMIISNYSQWEGRSSAYDHRAVYGVVEVPMLFGGDLIGILGIEAHEPEKQFDVDDLRSLSLLAEQAAVALHNARLFSQIEDRNRELDRLSRASSTLIAAVSGDIPSLCNSIAELLVSEFNHSNCSIWLLAEDELTLSRGAIAGPYSEELRSSLLTTRGPGVIAKSIRTREIINLRDVSQSGDYLANWDKAHSELVVPMPSGERIVGVIDLQSPDLEAYGADDVRLIQLIASRAALMVEHIRLYQQTEHRLQQLTVLSNIDAAIASTMDLQVTLNILVSQISMHLHADAVDVLLFNSHLQQLEYAIGRGFRGTQIRRISLLLGEDQAGQAAMDRTVVSVFDLNSPDVVHSHPERIAGEDFVCVYAVPLIAKGQLKGVMELFFRHSMDHSQDWINFLEVLARQAAVAVEDARLFNEMQRSLSDLAVAYDASIEGWARLVQVREHEPDAMIASLSSLCLELCRRMGIPEAEMPHINRGVLLHDIGKFAIPDIILFKDGPLAEEEWQVVRSYPAFALDLLQPISYLRPATNIPSCHHERWDGSGYPRGIKGKEIPLEARIFSVVNAWTMLQYERPYRHAWSRQQATAYVHEQAGLEFDPEVVEHFIRLVNEPENVHAFQS